MALARGIRNNNPGNIEISPRNNWLGRVPLAQNTDGRFEQFAKMVYGLRALAKLLLNYYSQGYRTVGAVINRYAPPKENDTGAYIRAVEVKLGRSNLIFPQDLPVIIRAIVDHENGRDGARVTQSEILEGIRLVGNISVSEVVKPVLNRVVRPLVGAALLLAVWQGMGRKALN